MTQATLTLDGIDLISPDYYRDHGYPHAAWSLLRRQAPVHWHQPCDADPFWAISKHADIVQIGRAPERWIIAPRLAVFPEIEDSPDGRPEPRHLLTMDPPEHGAFRRLVSARFTPRAVKKLDAWIEHYASQVLDEFAKRGEGDFVLDVSRKLPVAMIAKILGVPEEDWEKLFEWTNETIGAGDPEYQRPGETPNETAERARIATFQYFLELTERKKREPDDDVVSALVYSELDGAPLPALELLSYFFLLMVAGNETTRNATSGGMLALMENPGEFEKLRRRPELIDDAVEEIVRWTTPVIQFCRTATSDSELRGQKIRAGESVCLFYASANRDEEVFDEPFRFRIDRHPNRHLAFGIGEHFCLGANLARRQLRTIYAQLVPRLEHIELAGPLERLRSSFVGGIKHMPVRYSIRP